MRIFGTTVVVLFALGVATISHAQGGTANADSNQSTMFWTTVFGFLAVLVTQIGLTVREARRQMAAEKKLKTQRDNDLEDRKAAREALLYEIHDRYKQQRIETIGTAVELAKVAERHKAEILALLKQHTELTRQIGDKADAAYEAGNNFHVNLQALKNELAAFANKQNQLDHIEDVAVDTQGKVTEIAAVTVKEKEG